MSRTSTENHRNEVHQAAARITASSTHDQIVTALRGLELDEMDAAMKEAARNVGKGMRVTLTPIVVTSRVTGAPKTIGYRVDELNNALGSDVIYMSNNALVASVIRVPPRAKAGASPKRGSIYLPQVPSKLFDEKATAQRRKQWAEIRSYPENQAALGVGQTVAPIWADASQGGLRLDILFRAAAMRYSPAYQAVLGAVQGKAKSTRTRKAHIRKGKKLEEQMNKRIARDQTRLARQQDELAAVHLKEMIRGEEAAAAV